MDKNQLIKKIAKLESVNDQLAAELNYINNLAKQLGFTDGIKTLKSAALDLLEEMEKQKMDDDQQPPIAS